MDEQNIFSFAKMKISDLKKFEKEYLAFKKLQYQDLKRGLSPALSLGKGGIRGSPSLGGVGEAHFENLILELVENKKGQEYMDKHGAIALLSEVHTDKKFRQEAMEMMTRLGQAMVDIEHDKEIYDLIIDYYQNNYTKDKLGLNEADKKLVEDLVKDYQRMGFALEISKQKELKKMIKELVAVENKFSKNLNDYQDFMLVKYEDLKELGENYISGLEKVGSKYKIDLSYPKLLPFLKYSSNRDLRKKLADLNSQKGGKKSLVYIDKMLKLRIAIAKILGYKNFVDFQAETRMAKNNSTIQKFLTDLKREILPQGKKDLLELKNFAKNNLNIKKLEYFDLSFVSNKLYEFKFALNEKVLKEYFEMNNTLDFMFKYFGDIFGFEVQEEKHPLWYQEVKTIKLIDKKSKDLLGYILLDLFPREGKFQHMGTINTKYTTKIKTFMCNFPKPTKSCPSLLTPYQVETLFHEFGHAMHFVLSKTKHLSQGSGSFAQDIVELPSQMLENFFYTESVLLKLSKHYKTGQALDKKIIQKIISAKNFQNGYSYTRQLVTTELDLNIHLGKITNNYPEYYKTLIKKYTGINISQKSLFPADLDHLSAGYEACLYSYLWSLVYALDVYESFAIAKNKNDLQKIGEKYRKEILEVGTSRTESESIEKFLGRKLNMTVMKKLFE